MGCTCSSATDVREPPSSFAINTKNNQQQQHKTSSSSASHHHQTNTTTSTDPKLQYTVIDQHHQTTEAATGVVTSPSADKNNNEEISSAVSGGNSLSETPHHQLHMMKSAADDETSNNSRNNSGLNTPLSSASSARHHQIVVGGAAPYLQNQRELSSFKSNNSHSSLLRQHQQTTSNNNNNTFGTTRGNSNNNNGNTNPFVPDHHEFYLPGQLEAAKSPSTSNNTSQVDSCIMSPAESNNNHSSQQQQQRSYSSNVPVLIGKNKLNKNASNNNIVDLNENSDSGIDMLTHQQRSKQYQYHHLMQEGISSAANETPTNHNLSTKYRTGIAAPSPSPGNRNINNTNSIGVNNGNNNNAPSWKSFLATSKNSAETSRNRTPDSSGEYSPQPVINNDKNNNKLLSYERQFSSKRNSVPLALEVESPMNSLNPNKNENNKDDHDDDFDDNNLFKASTATIKAQPKIHKCSLQSGGGSFRSTTSSAKSTRNSTNNFLTTTTTENNNNNNKSSTHRENSNLANTSNTEPSWRKFVMMPSSRASREEIIVADDDDDDNAALPVPNVSTYSSVPHHTRTNDSENSNNNNIVCVGGVCLVRSRPSGSQFSSHQNTNNNHDDDFSSSSNNTNNSHNFQRRVRRIQSTKTRVVRRNSKRDSGSNKSKSNNTSVDNNQIVGDVSPCVSSQHLELPAANDNNSRRNININITNSNDAITDAHRPTTDVRTSAATISNNNTNNSISPTSNSGTMNSSFNSAGSSSLVQNMMAARAAAVVTATDERHLVSNFTNNNNHNNLTSSNDDVVEINNNEAIDTDLTDAPSSFDFEFFVIGCGPGGISCGTTVCFLAPDLLANSKIGACNYVASSGTTDATKYGIGGTCLNAGCIPKKLFHNTARIGEMLTKSTNVGDCGWKVAPPSPVSSSTTTTDDENVVTISTENPKYYCDWESCRQNINNHIRMVSQSYKTNIKHAGVCTFNNFARFVDRWTIELRDPKTGEFSKRITSRRFLIATGCRPTIPTEEECPGARKYGIVSDDLFWLTRDPKKTLVVGSGYVALECASSLNGMGRKVTVMMRSKTALRGFDQECVKKIVESMKKSGVEFIEDSEIRKIEKLNDDDSKDHILKVHYYDKQSNTTKVFGDDKEHEQCFNTVLFAIGRTPQTKDLNAEKIGLKLDPVTKKIVIDKWNRTSVSNIYSVGDVSFNTSAASASSSAATMLEVAPIAVKSGNLLAKRLYFNKPFSKEMNKNNEKSSLFSVASSSMTTTTKQYVFKQTLDYNFIPTTVYASPLEFGSVGVTTTATTTTGEDDDENGKYIIERKSFFSNSVRNTNTQLMMKNGNGNKDQEEATTKEDCFMKLVIDKETDKIVGIHIVSLNASDLLQGLAIAMKSPNGLTREILEDVLPF